MSDYTQLCMEVDVVWHVSFEVYASICLNVFLFETTIYSCHLETWNLPKCMDKKEIMEKIKKETCNLPKCMDKDPKLMEKKKETWNLPKITDKDPKIHGEEKETSKNKKI